MHKHKSPVCVLISISPYSNNTEAVLDRLPTAKIIEQTDDYALIEAEVYGKGIIMWLLSQGTKVEVVKPDSLREEMKKQLQDMLQRYDNNKE